MPGKSSYYKREGLRTLVETVPINRPVTYGDRIMLIGSCFTEHIGNRLKSLKFAVDMNPFGIVYNPLSMAEQLGILMHPRVFSRDDLVFHEGLWHSWQHHSRFSHPDPELLTEMLSRQTRDSSAFLKQAGLLVLTFGTPEAFFLRTGDRLVSNCHKLPAGEFYSRKPGPDELAELWIPLLEALMAQNPGLRICLSVSPVRYFKDGPAGNQMSKSILFLFIGTLMEKIPDLFYFPSYEIFMDDLRDYRYYDTDMMHPGDSGIGYVWEKFVKTCIDPSVYPLMDEVGRLVKAAHHRPGMHVTDTHRQFVAALLAKIRQMQSDNPNLDFTEEVEHLVNQTESGPARL
ncbi:MAG: GSCFA domain-containing protein [Bacteroidales bacterium]|jgi:hypothetical protein